jgi:endonuclease/exonuclease/phosphatase family metal-dependent hydrolase
VQEHGGGWETFLPNTFGDIYTCYTQNSKALYFRTSRYDILEKGAFFLSPTPDVRSQFEGDSGPRSCIWAIVKDKLLGMEILYINCHPDWNNDTQRALQVDVIFDVMGEKMEKYPTIFCGDFNTEPTGPVYSRIVGEFKDPYVEAERNLSEVDYTCHLFGESSTFIDYTFYNNTFKPTLYRIISEMYNGHVSDHFGTFTDFALES